MAISRVIIGVNPPAIWALITVANVRQVVKAITKTMISFLPIRSDMAPIMGPEIIARNSHQGYVDRQKGNHIRVQYFVPILLQEVGQIQGDQEHISTVRHAPDRGYRENGPHSRSTKGVLHSLPVGVKPLANVNAYRLLPSGVSKEHEDNHAGSKHDNGAEADDRPPVNLVPGQIP